MRGSEFIANNFKYGNFHPSSSGLAAQQYSNYIILAEEKTPNGKNLNKSIFFFFLFIVKRIFLLISA